MKRFAHLFICGVVVISAAHAFQKPKSQKEVEAINAMLKATTPDAQIAAAEDLLTRFADTEFKPMALYLEADDYQRKGDFTKCVVYGERTIEADPKSFQAMVLLARQYAGHTTDNDLDKEEKLTKATKYANDAIAVVNANPPKGSLYADAQWDAVEKDGIAGAHEALGMVADVRKKFDVASTEYKTALDSQSSPDPATMVRYAVAQEHAGKYDDAIATLDKVIADPNAAKVVKDFATNEKAKAAKMKDTAKK